MIFVLRFYGLSDCAESRYVSAVWVGRGGIVEFVGGYFVFLVIKAQND